MTKNETSGPVSRSSSTTRASRGAEGAVDHHHANRRLGLVTVLGNDHALAGGQTVGLDHDRAAELAAANRPNRVVGVGADPVSRGRHAVPVHEVLGERLACFEACGQPPGPEDGTAAGAEQIGDTTLEGDLGTYDGQIDPLLLGKREHRLRIGGVNRGGLKLPRDARITRCADDPVDAGLGGERGAERMFAGASAGHQDSHVSG